MKEEQIEIINRICPELRFGQLLTDLNILEFANKADSNESNYNLRDIFTDNDKTLLKRIKTSDLYERYYDKSLFHINSYHNN